MQRREASVDQFVHEEAGFRRANRGGHAVRYAVQGALGGAADGRRPVLYGFFLEAADGGALLELLRAFGDGATVRAGLHVYIHVVVHGRQLAGGDAEAISGHFRVERVREGKGMPEQLVLVSR